MHNFTSNRLTDYIQFKKPNLETDNYGEKLPDIFVFDSYADVQVKSGSQLNTYNVGLTESIITVLCWFNSKVSSSQVIEWDNNRYEIQHVQPAGDKKSMVITAKSIGEQTY